MPLTRPCFFQGCYKMENVRQVPGTLDEPRASITREIRMIETRVSSHLGTGGAELET